MNADDNATRDPAFPLPHILQPGEVIERQAHAEGFLIAVTPQRIIVTDHDRPVMDIYFDELRRIQFDLERDRTATLVMVPEHIRNEPRVFSVPIANITETALALAHRRTHQQVGRQAGQADPAPRRQCSWRPLGTGVGLAPAVLRERNSVSCQDRSRPWSLASR